MKLNAFKIRKVPTKLKDDSVAGEEQGTTKTPSDTQQILQQMQALLKYALDTTNKGEEVFQGLQYRDRMTKSTIKGTIDHEDRDTVEAWIGEVCRNILSTTFHYYLEEDMTFEQAKIYCCEEILRNISYFAEKHEVTAEFYQTIDKIMKDKIMPYLALKYPLSETVNSNKALSRIVKEINNIEMISNDFFYNSNIMLEYRENGNYNDIVMQVLNELISLADSPKAEKQQITVFKEFDNSMAEFFERVYDPNWMAQKNLMESQSLNSQIVLEGAISEKILKDIKGAEEAEKYKEKVQEYTHYEIGRKIPESVHSYTEDQIKSKHLVIKSPEVLRIMTKWCEELWEKFENENYYIDRSEGLTMLNSKQINILYEWLRLDLKQRLKDEKAKIQKYMSNVENNLYQQEFKILQSELISKESPFLNRYERVCGKFSTKVVDNLKNCIVIYLNRLIHGLMFVSNEVFRVRQKGMPSWPTAANLLSFKIGDLLRCRVSSQEKEIIRLYEQLHSTSERNPERLKIIRVKNRLKSGTNDLLINVLYNQSFIAEIQLKVKEKVGNSRFSKCSYNFSHFIYEIQRSYFGPISEICSIWSNLDARANMYRKLVQDQNLNVSFSKNSNTCSKNQIEHSFEGISNSPFICSDCGKSFSSDNYFLSHKKCKMCNAYKCSLCQIKERQSKDLLKDLTLNENIPLNLNEERSEWLPSIGICVKIENNAQGKVNYFKVIPILQKSYVFFLKNNEQFQLAEELKTQKARNKFLKQNIIYEHYGIEPQIFKMVTIQKAVKHFIMPLYVRNCYRLQKQAVSLNKLSNIFVETQLLQKMLKDPKDSKKAVKPLEISSQNLVSLDFIPDDFVNLEFINVNLNKIKSLQSLIRFKKLHTIFCLSNQISQFPVSLCDLPLKTLSIAQNTIIQLPSQFQKLQKLEMIRFSSSRMATFPEPITKLLNIKEIYAFSNALKQIPDSLSNCTKLKILKLSTNKLTKLPKSLQNLVALQVLEIDINQLEQIDIEFKKTKALKTLNLSKNKLSKIPACLNECDSLVTLKLSLNKIAQASFENISMQKIQEIYLSEATISNILHLRGIKNVATLDLARNSLKTLPEEISQLKKLNSLNLLRNALKSLPAAISELTNLKKLNISENKKITVPSTFSKLNLDSLLINICQVEYLFPQILQLKHLKELNMSDNLIKELPANIKQLKNLEIFEFANNYIAQFPEQIGLLKNLKRISFKQRGAFEIGKIVEISFYLISSSLNLSGSSITLFPSNIPFNSYLEELNLSSNQIAVIPASISNLVNLKSLNMSTNKLIELCDEVFQLKELTDLNLKSNKLERLPNCFGRLKKLSSLNIEMNDITEIPESLKSIFTKTFKFNYTRKDNIQYPLWFLCKDKNSPVLKLQNKQLKNLPKFDLNNMYENVYLDHNAFDEFPKELFIMKRLTVLDLSHNKIKQIPKAVRYLQRLSSLTLSSNCIEEIPEAIQSIKKLTFLSIEGNPLSKVQEGFANFTNLELRISPQSLEQFAKNNCMQFIKVRHLNFKKMELTDLPPCMAELADIKSLDISGNKLAVFPQQILKIISLKLLTIEDQPIQQLPEEISGLKNLTSLNASSCQLQSLPASLSQLTLLQRLQLNNNSLSTLPPNLSALKKLMLNGNKFTEFPASLTSSPNLNEIQISDNKIVQFHECLTDLLKLQTLFVERNLISSIPQFLSETTLRKIQLFDNPISSVQRYQQILKKLCPKSKQAIKKFDPHPT